MSHFSLEEEGFKSGSLVDNDFFDLGDDGFNLLGSDLSRVGSMGVVLALLVSDGVDLLDSVGEVDGVTVALGDGGQSDLNALSGGIEDADVLLGSLDVLVEGLLEVVEEGALVLVLFFDFLDSVSDVVDEEADEFLELLSDVALVDGLGHDLDEVGEDGSHSDEFGVGGFDLELDLSEVGGEDIGVFGDFDEGGAFLGSEGGAGALEDVGDAGEVGGDGLVVEGPGFFVLVDVLGELSVVAEFFVGSVEESSVDFSGSSDEFDSSLEFELSVFVLVEESGELLEVGFAVGASSGVLGGDFGFFALGSLVVVVEELSEGGGV